MVQKLVPFASPHAQEKNQLLIKSMFQVLYDYGENSTSAYKQVIGSSSLV